MNCTERFENAIMNNDTTTCDNLIRCVPDLIDPMNDNCFALRFAAESGMLAVVKFLVSIGTDISSDNWAAIRWSAENGHTEVLRVLLDCICPEHLSQAINIFDGMALQDAVENGHIDCVQLLLEYGADHTLCYSFAIDLAIISEDKKMIDLLVSYGAWDCRLNYDNYRGAFSKRHMQMVLNGTIKKKWVIKAIKKDDK